MEVSEKGKRSYPGADDPDGPNEDFYHLMQNFNSMTREDQAAFMQSMRIPRQSKATRPSYPGQDTQDPSPCQ